ncbi:hypothetical protein GQ53DRAFT_813703 [Thozetella sp. PMI_491]|nr:hypothetical protein GQ53DRAFT_813703 [Thozetella sp. PMI_491]
MLTKAVAVAVLALSSAVLAAPRPEGERRQAQNEGVTNADQQTILYPGRTNKALHGALDVAEFWAPAATDSGSPTTEAPTATAASTQFTFRLGGAPEPTAAPDLEGRDANVVKRNPPYITISVINSLIGSTRGVLTAHGQNAGAPSPVRGNLGQGVINNGQADFIAVPTGWAGRIAVVENGGRAIVGDESLIEASFVTQGGSDAVFDINVSYVDGFSLPITCSCDVGVIAGCNKYLWDLHQCPDDNGVGSCRNPMRNNGNSATDFFAPCQHAAYAYANDSAANTGNGVCHGDTVTCCIGVNCPANPRQPA